MLIDNPDAFKSWLTSVLEPLCDADPEALAKYVYALVKKDKTIEALRECMIEQLDVFLQAETKPFVELLFKTLETQEYILPVIPNANPPNPNVPVVIKKEPVPVVPTARVELIVKDIKPIIPVSTLPNLSESVNGNVVVKKEETTPVKRERERDHRKSDSEKEERTRSGRRHRSTSRNRSRSRSWDRGKRSRSRDRSRERSRERVVERERRDRSRPWRNKSPPRRYDRRRSRSVSPVGVRARTRSRSPKHSYRGRYRNRSPPRSVSRSRSRSNDRVRSDKDKKDPKADAKDSKDENSGGATPTQDSNHGDTDMRLTNTTQSIQSVVSALVNPSELRSGQGITGPAQPTPGFTGKRRCRDFDEKGYCMRGEMCPYDHGVDPVVLEDSALTRVLTFGPQGPNGAPGVEGPPVPALLPPPMVPGGPMMHPHMGTRPQHPGPSVDFSEYNPSAPQMWHRPGFRGPRPMMGPRMGPQMGPFAPLPSMQRELISVPVTDNQNFKRRNEYQHEGSPEVPLKKKGGFDFNRLGPRSKNPINCSLELKKVPRGLNNIAHLNNHFAKFGKIVNIQVNFEGDPEGAIVTFSSHAEANAAYRSTEAVLNNRFIKVFWHSSNNDGKQENVPPRPVKDRLGQAVTTAPNANKVLNLLQPKQESQPTVENQENVENDEKASNATTKTTVYVPTKKDGAQIVPQTQDSKALANAAIVKGQEILAAKEQLKKKHEEKRKEAIKITQDLRKRKQELLEKQLAQQKLLIEKLEKTNPTGQQRDLLMSTIKTVQESIESIRKDMLSQQPSAPTTKAAPRKSKEEAQKEVLDAELDLITRQQEGGDTSELQKRLLELRAQAQSLGARGRSRGRRGRFVAGGINRLHTSLLSKNNLVDNNKNSFSRGGNAVRGATRGTFQKHTVDHRPTRLLVSGYEADESDSVLAHFAQYGEITDYVSDDSTPSVILNYKMRKEAEMALLKGKNFQDRTLSITWCNSTSQLNNQRGPTRTVLLSESTDEQLLEQTLLEADDDPLGAVELSEAALLQDDEEEDDENEDRSWRR